ncbi:hypothetical protein E9993_06240 [Labilibacter sediminis]|nr:hypothetical protein E9993_06240 [Labilibacter sediminis]
MMTDKLEKYINENRSSFDDLSPSADLWDKISQHNKSNKKNSTKIIWYRISGAAAVFLILLLSYPYFTTQKNKTNTLSELNTEILETEQYYHNKVMVKKQKVFNLTSNQPEIKKDVEKELALLDTVMLELKNDLDENIANEEVIEAMIQNYRMKLQILEDILKYLEPDSEPEKKTGISSI